MGGDGEIQKRMHAQLLAQNYSSNSNWTD